MRREKKISLQVTGHQVIKGSVPSTYLLLYWFAKISVTTYHGLGSLKKREKKKKKKHFFSYTPAPDISRMGNHEVWHLFS